MTVMIEPGLLAGAVTPPPSKSQAHRLLIARALAGENIDDPAHRADSQDIRATRDCLKSLREGEGELPVLECGESGSTLRFLIPVALALRGGGMFRGRGRLMDRPQEPYFRIFDGMGITHRREGDSLTVRGRLRPGEYPLPGDVSSQFVTGLLFALPLLEGESIIRLTSPLESRGYVDMTLQVLRDRGIRVEELPEGFRVPGGQQYGRGTLGEEADYSQAAFWLAAAGLGSPLTVEGLDPDSTQGDRCAVPYFQQLAGPGRVELDIAQCTDLAPALAVRAALRPGQTARLVNAGRLRLKECDRLAAIPEELNKLGGQLTEGADFLEIRGVERLQGGSYSIIPDQIEAGTFMAAVAACGGSVLVKNVIPKHLECITAKLKEMGVEVTEFDDSVLVRRENRLTRTNIKTMPYPGFPTDMQPQMTTALCLAEGTSIVTEGVWDSRYRYTEELARMGASIHVDGKIAVIEGVEEFKGAPVRAHDLRAGAAMVIAGLAAKGVTEVEQVQNIERGYETLVEKFVALGADMYRSEIPDSMGMAERA